VAEQLIRNQQVAGSNPIAGSNKINSLSVLPFLIFRIGCTLAALQIIYNVTISALRCAFGSLNRTPFPETIFPEGNMLHHRNGIHTDLRGSRAKTL
jgi:hypothetical protein